LISQKCYNYRRLVPPNPEAVRVPDDVEGEDVRVGWDVRVCEELNLILFCISKFSL
jgi:hypothetical protein